MTRDDIAPLLGILFLFGLFACVVIGKQEQEDEIAKYEPVQVVQNDVVERYAGESAQVAIPRIAVSSRMPPDMLKSNSRNFMKYTWKFMGADK